MPALNFHRQFSAAVREGTKRQTIRKVRKTPIAIGDRLYLYTGQRTPNCEKLGEAECTEVATIRINANRGYITIDGHRLEYDEAVAFAKADGFPRLVDFGRWFLDRYGPKFEGVVIYWVPPGWTDRGGWLVREH